MHPQPVATICHEKRYRVLNMLKYHRELIKQIKKWEAVQKAYVADKGKKHPQIVVLTLDGIEHRFVAAKSPSCPNAGKNALSFMRKAVNDN